MRRPLAIRAALLASLTAMPLLLGQSQRAEAQWAVIDAANLAQNILTEFNTLTTTVNQVTQIANQVTSLSHEVQNLVDLPAALVNQILNAYLQVMNSLNQTWGQINGLAANLNTLVARFNQRYPNRQLGVGNLTPQQILAQTQTFLTQVRGGFAGGRSAGRAGDRADAGEPADAAECDQYGQHRDRCLIRDPGHRADPIRYGYGDRTDECPDRGDEPGSDRHARSRGPGPR